jgi:hypothetical protein
MDEKHNLTYLGIIVQPLVEEMPFTGIPRDASGRWLGDLAQDGIVY